MTHFGTTASPTCLWGKTSSKESNGRNRSHVGKPHSTQDLSKRHQSSALVPRFLLPLGMWPGVAGREASPWKAAALHGRKEMKWICKSPNSTCAAEEGAVMEGPRFREGEFK